MTAAGADEEAVAPPEGMDEAADEQAVASPEGTDEAADEQAVASPEGTDEAADEVVAPPEGEEEAPVSGPAARRAGRIPAGIAARTGRLALRWRIASMAAIAVLAVAAVVSAVLLVIAAQHDDAVSGAKSAARQAAAAEMQQILSYDYRTINSDLARASSDTTGEFHQQFRMLAGQIIAPAAAQQQTVTKATVPNASVVSATTSQVVVLLFVDQSTSSKTHRQPQQVASQVRVTMQQSGGRWLVAQFQAL